jgi:myo-inositol-1(or 4)-monophosphatase
MSFHGLSSADILSRIEEALAAAARTAAAFVPGKVKADQKPDFSPVTEADRAIDRVLKKILLRSGEGWLSEESVDSPDRLSRENVWVVDPLDGTLEFVQGIPEWCVSIGFAHRGKAFAGGIVNPMTGELILGSMESGVIYNGSPAQPTSRTNLAGAVVLASRSEVKRGEWERFRGSEFEVRPMGSVAYKLALVAAGRADATWTLSPKNEWDVAAGVALLQAGGGYVTTLEGSAPLFNNRSSLLSGLVAGAPGLQKGIEGVLDLSLTTAALT